MKRVSIWLLITIFLLGGCDRSGEGKETKSTEKMDSVTDEKTKPKSIETDFEVISKSNTLRDMSGNFRDRGHYSMIFQAKRKADTIPVMGLADRSYYTLFENETSVLESKMRITQDTKTVSNQIMLLLDFSGSIVNDCQKEDANEATTNLCFQIVNSSKQFVDKIVSQNQRMAIYYFNSQRKILPLFGDPTDDVTVLKSSLDKLYSSAWRQEYLLGYESTNLYGGIIDATEVVCHWFQDCEVGRGAQDTAGDKQNYDYATIVTFTDGRHTTGSSESKRKEMLRVLPLYKRNHYYTIGLGDVDDEVLKSIGSSGYLKATQTEKLHEEFVKLGEQLSAFSQSFYRLDYCPAQQGGKLDLRVDVKDTKQGYEGTIEDEIKLLDGVDFRCDL